MGKPAISRSALRDTRRSSGSAAPARRAPRSTWTSSQSERVLRLQREAGNRAVAQLLRAPGGTSGPHGWAGQPAVQRDTTHRENPEVTDVHPKGTMSDAEWTAAFEAATAKPSLAAYTPLFRDIATVAGMGAMPGFDLSTIQLSDGKTAKPGFNITLDTSGEPGHTGWVEKGAFGVKLNPSKKAALTASIAIILGPGALHRDKDLSLRTVRHEMVHARHKMLVLDAVRTWQKAPGREGLDDWLRQRQKQKKMSGLDVALVGKGALDARANTEVLAYVEGFMTDFHRRAPTLAEAGMSFFELLGAVETNKLYTWKQADQAVRQEALTRLTEYRATLDADHRRLWKQWLDQQLATVAKDDTGRKEFLTALAGFVV